MHKNTIITFLIVFLLGSCTAVSTPGLMKSPVASQYNSSATPILKVSGTLTPTVASPTSTPSTQLKTTASRALITSTTQVQRTNSFNTPTGIATAVSSIGWYPTPIPISAVEQKCLPIEDILSREMTISGTIILAKMLDQLNEGEVYLLDLQNNEKHLLLEKQNLTDLWRVNYAVSPDKKWFAYFEPTITGKSGQLRLISADGQEQLLTLDWNNSWGRIVGWSDDLWLTLWPIPKNIGEYGTVVRLILNVKLMLAYFF